MSLKINIEQASYSDTGAISEIVKLANNPVAKQFALTRDNAPSHPSLCTPDWIRAGMDRGERYFIGERIGLKVGCVAYESPEPGLAYLNRLAVLPDYQNLGVGQALVHHILTLAKEDQKNNVSIGIIKAHTILRDWYAGLGFIPSGTKTFDHLPFDVQFMTCDLR